MPNHESIPKATVHATAITNTSQTGNPFPPNNVVNTISPGSDTSKYHRKYYSC
jgi:hypothetical protein